MLSLGFGTQGLGHNVWIKALGYKIIDLWLKVLGSGSRVNALQSRVESYAFRNLNIGIGFCGWGLGCRVQGSGFRVQGSGFRVQGSGFRVQGSGFRD